MDSPSASSPSGRSKKQLDVTGGRPKGIMIQEPPQDKTGPNRAASRKGPGLFSKSVSMKVPAVETGSKAAEGSGPLNSPGKSPPPPLGDHSKLF